MASDPVDLIADLWRRPQAVRDRVAAGRAIRRSVPRRALAKIDLRGRNPLGILGEQNVGRLPDLVPLRVERMSADPFSFYRGAAAVQAADLARSPHSGILVPSCGDAHVANFGLYASPMRTLLFDINDFDEAAWAPWEWDVKRLVASIVLSGEASGRSPDVVDEAGRGAVTTYAGMLASRLERSPLDRYYEHFDPLRNIRRMDSDSERVFAEAIRAAQRRTGERAAKKLTERDEHGRLRFVDEPPTMAHDLPDIEGILSRAIVDFESNAHPDIRMLLSHFTAADIARRVVGVGSVGTRCYVVVFEDGDGNTLLLQVKQAQQSVLAGYGGVHQPPALHDVVRRNGEGARVVGMQRTLQSLSDPFLSHLRGLDGDYYVRQFRDMKGGVDTETLDDRPFVQYALACAGTLARAHGQSPEAATVSGYIGGGATVADAILGWAKDYAVTANADYRDFVAAQTVSSGAGDAGPTSSRPVAGSTPA